MTNATGTATDTVDQVAGTVPTPPPTADPDVVKHTVGRLNDIGGGAVNAGTHAVDDAVSGTVDGVTGGRPGGGAAGGSGALGLGLPGAPGDSGAGGTSGGGGANGTPGDGIRGHDTRDPLTPGALAAFAQAPNGAGGQPGDAPAGILGLVPALGGVTAEDGHGLLTGVALLAAGAPGAPGAGGGGSSGSGGVDDILDDFVHALKSVVDKLPDWSRPVIAVLLLMVLILAVRNWFSGRRARKLEGQLLEKAADNAVLQAALVPDLPERLGGVALSVDYRPADGLASGGDFYDAFALDEHRVGVILGDVSGHDRNAIRRASDVRHKLRAYLELGLEPRVVLQMAGEALSSSDSLEGDFATAAVAVHDVRAGTLTYACAGHPPPILTGSAAHHPLSVCSSPALGWGLPTGRRQTTVVLADSAAACFFTDGLIEARHHSGFVGRAALERMVADLGDSGTAGDLLREVIGLAHEADDDLAALIMRPGTPVAASGARVEELLFEAAEVQRKAPERFLAACDAPMVVIEQLSEVARQAVEDGGRALLRVRFDAATGALDAVVKPIAGPAARPRAAAL